MDPCSIIEFLLSQTCHLGSAKEINDRIQHKYGSPLFINTVFAKSLNICTKRNIELHKISTIWMNRFIIDKSCEIYYNELGNENNCDKRFEVIPVSILRFLRTNDNLTSAHSITILIDHEEKIIEIFDALGKTRVDKMCDVKILEFLNEKYPNYEILLPETICPYGPQIFNREGTCVLWAILYMFVRIKCKGSTRNDINRLFYDIRTEKLGYFQKLFNEKSIIERTTKLILGFGCYLEKILASLNLEPLKKYHDKILNLINTSDIQDEYMPGNISTSHDLLLLRDYVYYLKKYKLYTSELENIITSNPFLYSQYVIND